MNQQPKFTCFICGNELTEKRSASVCTFCRKEEQGDWVCPGGHYICEECRLSPAEKIIKSVCLNSSSQNPWDIATLIMQHPLFRHHGVEHHLLVAPVILTALANSGQINFDKEKIAAALKRTADIPFGVCGSRGDCGACIGAGAAFSIILKASFSSDKERSLVLKTTAGALLRIAELGGARCCKQSVYAAVETSSLVFKNELKLDLEIADKKCRFSQKISDCKREGCPYY
jgi:hypothetical protein